MYDRQTYTLWGNLTGEPVVGKMATSGIRLKMLPVTVTTWIDWKNKHPHTKVLHLENRYGAQFQYRYLPGLADRARKDVKFPVWLKSQVLPEKEEVYALRIGEKAKAYSVKSIIQAKVLNDRIGETAIVLVGDSESEAIRAYQRGIHTFDREFKDETGQKWMVTEEALVSGEKKLLRVPGHLSLWFAWYGFFPHTEVYE